MTVEGAKDDRRTGLTDQIEAGLLRLSGTDVAVHPDAYEAMDAEISTALRSLEQL